MSKWASERVSELKIGKYKSKRLRMYQVDQINHGFHNIKSSAIFSIYCSLLWLGFKRKLEDGDKLYALNLEDRIQPTVDACYEQWLQCSGER